MRACGNRRIVINSHIVPYPAHCSMLPSVVLPPMTQRVIVPCHSIVIPIQGMEADLLRSRVYALKGCGAFDLAESISIHNHRPVSSRNSTAAAFSGELTPDSNPYRRKIPAKNIKRLMMILKIVVNHRLSM